MKTRLPLAGLAILGALFGTAAAAQTPRPHLQWRTVETARFRYHYPAAAEAWTLELASRMESVGDAVGALVGARPRARVTVVVDDPVNESNGSAWALVDRPVIYVWPTPAGARSSIGHSRNWVEELAVHEFAHIAHLTRPSRNARERLFWRLSPVPGSPLGVRTPRWAIEGYATYVEGRLTGSGRPYSAGRAAALRQWALEGQLPTYGQLNGAQGYRRGEMAYLAGSAFMEWLVARAGEESLPKVWRRLSARQRRSFDQAFAGVYGGSPAALYGRFTAELTGRALSVEQQAAADSSRAGELVLARRGYGYDDPALSPDGSRIAVRVRLADRPGPVIVVHAAADTMTARERAARARAARLDPEDVPAVEYLPRPRREVARLDPREESGFEEPRFFRDGRRVLVTRWTPRSDGSFRPDLYEWTLVGGRVRRITRGAGVRGADPAPDGRRAVGVRCEYGICALVRVELGDGRVTTLVAGQIDRMFDRPRYSPDGRTIAVAVQTGGRWRVALVDAASGALRMVGPDDAASRYEPAFTADGRRLVVTSERGGIPNIEEITIGTGATRTLTSVAGAAAAPVADPGDSTVYFLDLRSTGLDLRRVPLSVASAGPPLVRDSALAPAVPLRPTAVVDTFARGAVSDPRAYGLGPRHFRYLPAGAAGRDGALASLGLANVDPVARLAVVAQAGLGERSTWRGGSLAAAYRGMRPSVSAELFAVRHRPRDPLAPAPPPDLALLAGAALASTLDLSYGWRAARYHLGLSAASLKLDVAERAPRRAAFAEVGEEYRATIRGTRLAFGASAHGSLGTTGGAAWRRGLAALSGRASALGLTLSARGTLGAVNAGAPAFEQFAAGGVAAPFVDRAILSQRVAMPSLPVGFAGGRRLASYRFATAFAGLEPYYAALSAGDRLGGAWTRVVGAEHQVTVEPVGLVGLPRVQITAGVGYPLDGPYRRDTQLYGAVTLRP